MNFRKAASRSSRASLTMDRQGAFVLKTFGPNHCGIGSKIAVKYHLVCECKPTLDKRGFLFDQINVDKFFQGIKRSSLSCEKLVISCTNKLVDMIRTENPGCKISGMKLTLSPEPFAASMTYTWKD